MKTLKDMSRAGVTLVELLVVILIVTILAVSLLPMFRKFVNQAQYASEAKPLIGHLRTQISLYQYDNGNMLPAATNKLGTMSFARASANDPWIPQFDENFQDPANPQPAGWSFLRMMDVPISEMQGNHMNPGHLEFAIQLNGTAYAYALGIFGREGGLQPGTGYAVYEAFFPEVAAGHIDMTDANGQTIGQSDEHGFKLIGTFERMSADGGEKHFALFPNTNNDAWKVCLVELQQSALEGAGATVKTISDVADAVAEMNINNGGEWKFQGL